MYIYSESTIPEYTSLWWASAFVGHINLHSPFSFIYKGTRTGPEAGHLHRLRHVHVRWIRGQRVLPVDGRGHVRRVGRRHGEDGRLLQWPEAAAERLLDHAAVHERHRAPHVLLVLVPRVRAGARHEARRHRRQAVAGHLQQLAVHITPVWILIRRSLCTNTLCYPDTLLSRHLLVCRMFDDIDDSWQSILSIINWFGDNSYGQSKWAGPNHWNDADMLLIGNYGTLKFF